jgi:hypothetical protein
MEQFRPGLSINVEDIGKSVVGVNLRQRQQVEHGKTTGESKGEDQALHGCESTIFCSITLPLYRFTALPRYRSPALSFDP